MLRTLIFAALALIGPAYAADAGIPEICKAKAAAAASIMKERQSGARMLDMIDRIHESDHAVRDRTQMVIAAFSAPEEKTTEGKERSVVRFENQIYLECVNLWTP